MHKWEASLSVKPNTYRGLVGIIITILLSFSSCQPLDKKVGELGSVEDNAAWSEPPPPPEPVELDLTLIKERGVLKAIINNSSTSYFVYKGQPMGYEFDLLTRFAEHIGLKLELVVTPDIENAFRSLNAGEGDLIAYNLTITKERIQRVAFADHSMLVKQVLVQKRPDNWRKMKLHEIERTMLRNPVDLIGKKVNVKKNSSHAARLRNLSEEIGGDILILEDFGDVQSETLIKRVADGEIQFTVADENVALVNATYYPDLDVKTPVSFSQKIAWAVRKNAPLLLNEINKWLAAMKKRPAYYTIYNKYFKNTKATSKRAKDDFGSLSQNRISKYDDLIKEAADSLDWDWRLLASQMFQESRFEPTAKSWAGARGLMQIMPATGKSFGVTNLNNPELNIKAGYRYLQWLEKYWMNKVKDPEERLKFMLASYNVGQGHVDDARRLAEKYRRNPNVWSDNVEYFVLKKSHPRYYRDPVVRYGYCRGEEPVKYVKSILNRYEQYKNLINA
ncbi:MAG: transporter substrate-binding domain-containing protein [Bacteroidetes bacterium]|nr:transporter substrate-binding domain-containing protein [Bacteroidota bacterium]